MNDVFRELHDSSGNEWKEAQSAEYSLKEIIDYLQSCTESPQNDTHVSFIIRDTGELRIVTGNDEMPAEIEASGFTLAKGETL